MSQDKTQITVPVTFRLAKYFNTNPKYWLATQMKYDIAKAADNKDVREALKSINKIDKTKKKAKDKPPR
jgi:plasmid maintenance system antidote protein VapI